MAFETAIRNALALTLFPMVGLLAQAPQPPATLRVNTQLVEVSVVVKDSHGSPVTDLKAGDFEIYDQGKKQEIRVFKLEDYRPAAAQPPASPAPIPPSAPAAYAFSNRSAAEPGAPNAPTILVIDAGNTWDSRRMTWQDLVYAREQVIRFLRQVRPEDRLGIYLMGSNRFWILHEYTQNCADLLARLAGWKPADGAVPGNPKSLDVWSEFALHVAGVDAETARAIHRGQFWGTTAGRPPVLPEGSHDAPEKAEADFGAYLPPDQTRPITLLEAVSNHLAAVPGRKNVVLISGTTFLPPERKIWLKILRTIIQDGVSVYAVDPGGLAPYPLEGGCS